MLVNFIKHYVIRIEKSLYAFFIFCFYSNIFSKPKKKCLKKTVPYDGINNHLSKYPIFLFSFECPLQLILKFLDTSRQFTRYLQCLR